MHKKFCIIFYKLILYIFDTAHYKLHTATNEMALTL